VDDVCGDLSNLHKRKFDRVLAIEVLEHVHNPRRLIENMLCFAKSNGVCILTTPNALGYEISYRFRGKKQINNSVNQYLSPCVIKGLINRLGGSIISQNFGSRIWLKHINIEFQKAIIREYTDGRLYWRNRR